MKYMVKESSKRFFSFIRGVPKRKKKNDGKGKYKGYVMKILKIFKNFHFVCVSLLL